MSDYRISLGVDVNTSDIQNQIRMTKVDPIKVNLDFKNSRTEINKIKDQLGKMGFGNTSISKITKDLKMMNLSVNKITTNLKKNGNVEISVSGLDKLNRAVTLVSEYTKKGDVFGSRISQSFKTEVDEINDAFNLLKKKQKEINSLEFKLKGLDSKKDAAEIKELTSQIRNLKKEYNKLYSGYGDRLSSSQSAELTKGLRDAENKMKHLKSKMKDEIQFKIDTGDFNKDISNIESKVKNLGNVSKELKNSITQLKSNRTRMNTALGDGDIDTAIKAYERYLKILKTVNNQLGISSNAQKSIDVDFNDLIKLKERINKINEKLTKFKINPKANESSINELSRQLEEAEAAYDDLYNKLQGKLTSGQLDSLAESADKAKNKLRELEAELADTKRELDENLKLDKTNALLELRSLFEDGSQAAKVFGSRMEELGNKINECANDSDMRKIRKEISAFKKDVDNSNLQTETFGTKIKKQISRYGNYFSVASAVMYGTQAVRDMFEQVKLIDSAMTELKKVTDETDASYNQFLKNAASRSKVLGTTIDGLVGSTADFARLGYSFEDSQGLAEVANIYAVVGDEIESVEDATQSLVSTLAAFKDEMNDMSNTEFAMSIVDKMNEVANNYAISSGGLGEALQRSASSMAAANNTLDETIAMITAANEVAQNPEKVGNAMKTISMRIRGAKTELEEAGESTDGMVESTAKLREEIMALSGVDIMLNEDTFKSTYQIMDELAAKWKDLSDIQQATIIELMAGKHQGNIFASLMTNFDTARNALETSINSSGSALAEHAKWSESLEARLNKLKAAWQSLSQTFMKSDFLKGLIDAAIVFIDTLDKIVDKTGIIMPLLVGFAGKKIFNKIFDTAKMMQFGGGLTSIGDIISVLINSFKPLSAAAEAFGLAMAKNATGFAAFKAASGAFIGAINPVILGITAAVAAIGIGISLYDKYTESAEELAERIDDVTTKYKDQHSELSKLKGDYDTSNENSMISRYEELSKGVSNLGENIALTTDEYTEYQNIVEQIASTNPELIAGYDSQGNAILSCAGDVNALAESYKNLIKEQNREILTGKDENDKLKNSFSNAKDIVKDFNNDLNKEFDGISHKGAVDGMNWLENIIGKGALSEQEIKNAVDNLSGAQAMEISRLIEENGIKRDVLGSGDWGYETFQEHIVRAVKENKSEIDNTIKEVRSNVDSYAESLGAATGAYFDQAFLGGDETLGIKDYSSKISDRIQGILNQTASELDGISFIDIIGDADTNDAKWQALTDFYNSTLDAFANMNKSDAAKFEAAFDLKTKFNGGEISYGEYVSGIQDAGRLVDDLGLHKEIESQIKLNLGLSDANGDDVWSVENYDTMLNRLTSKEYPIQLSTEEAKAFLDDLTASEYSVAVGLIASDKPDLSKFNAESLRNHIEREAKISEALSFNTSISVDTAALETFNTALSESASAVGLTSESIGALESKYKKLEGYDSDKLFEATTNGVKLNREEVAKLEKQYQDLQKSKTQEHLDTLVDEYNRLTAEIDKNSNAAERASLIAERNGYLTQIESLAQYQAQLEGVTGAYQRWIDAQNVSEDYEGYEAVAKGWASVEDELSRGFLGNASKEYIDLLSGEDLRGKNIDDYAAAWGRLDDKVASTGYSIKDFFTLDDDGNITSTGIHRFFESIKKDFDNIYKQNDAGEWIYDFSQENLKAIQDKWGIGIEAIGLMLEAAVAAGYNVDWGGILDGIDLDTSTFETVLEYAEAAQEAFNKISNIDDVDFNFKTSNIEDAKSELEKAQQVYQDLITNDDGSINIDAEGAEEMRVVLAALTLQKQQLERPAIMDIKLSSEQAETDIGKATKAVQDLQNNLWALEQSVYNPEINSADVQGEIGNIIGQLNALEQSDPEIYAKLGLDDTQIASLKSAISNIDASIKAGVEPSQEDLSAIQSAIQGVDVDAVVSYFAENQEPPEDQEANVNYTLGTQESPIDKDANVNYILGSQQAPNAMTASVNYVGEATGTAHAGGTTYGRAFSRGNWGINGNGVALGGELGQELVVRDGKYFTIGDSGAEFFRYKKNDIVFNAAQTESLFKYGGIKGANPRGKMFASGTAFAGGNTKLADGAPAFLSGSVTGNSKFANSVKDGVGAVVKKSNFANISAIVTEAATKATEAVKKKSGGGSGGGDGGGGSSSNEESEFEEKIDWIETAIDRIERAIDKLDLKVNSTYRTWTERNTALADQIGKVGDKIDLQQQAYDRYLQEANSVGLSESYASKVRDGTIDIEKITDEELKKKIDEYKQW